jgi:hypothetical protein
MQSNQTRMDPSGFLPAMACLCIVLLMMMWPADAPWGGDDVTLISAAIKANHAHRLISAGLGGSFGYPYGPIPSQIYQALALFSEIPITLVRLHAALLAGGTAFALLYLATVLNLSPWFAPMMMVGPFFWFYSRLMWDNTFAIPVGTLLLAAYGDYLHRSSRAAFFTAVSCAVALPLIHPMTLPLVVPVVGHALLFRRTGIRKHWPGLIVIALCTTILSGAYVQRVADQMRQSPNLIPPRADALSRPQAAVFPLFSARLFNAYGFFDERGPEMGWEQSSVVVVARSISLAAYLLIWSGMLIAVFRIWKFTTGKTPVLRYSQEPGSADGMPGSSVDLRTGVSKITLPAICLAAMLLQSLMDARLRISPYPHYYTGTWVTGVIFLWIGIDFLKKIKLRAGVAWTYAISMSFATIAFAVDIHAHSGGSVWYGPSLGAQVYIYQQKTPGSKLPGRF